MRFGRVVVGAVVLALGMGPSRSARGVDDSEPAEGWITLEPGLEYGVFSSPTRSDSGDSKIRILRIDPGRFELRLMNASASEHGLALTPRDWATRNGLVAAINASMFQVDRRTSVSLMKSKAHTNSPWLSKDKAVLAFDRLDDSVPPVQIIDRQLQDFDTLKDKYETLVQSIRMVSLDGRNVWAPREQRWSTAAIGIDRRGRVLFIHVRSPYTTHELIDVLLQLPIDLRNAMYVEGGPQAQMYVHAGEREYELVGRIDTAFLDSDDTSPAWPVPNVIGVARSAPKSD